MHTVFTGDRLYVAVDILILTEKNGVLQVMLSRRTHPPCEGSWSLPGRLVAIDESAEETVQKLLSEMLPVANAYQEQLFTFTDPGRDPRGRVISAAYLVIIPWEQLSPAFRAESVKLRCFSVSNGEKGLYLTGEDGHTLDNGTLAFDHEQIIRTGITRLQGKIEYTDIGFRFLNDPEAFALGEIQRVFEAVLEKTLDTSNFRRFVLKRYEETGRIEQTKREEKKKRGRPAVLYRLTR